MPVTIESEVNEMVGQVSEDRKKQERPHLHIEQVKNGWILSDESCFNRKDKITVAVNTDDCVMYFREWIERQKEQ